jgi:hypothetical protein
MAAIKKTKHPVWVVGKKKKTKTTNIGEDGVEGILEHCWLECKLVKIKQN